MKVINKYVLLFILFSLCFPIISNAADSSVYFEHISSKEGLPQVSVNAITQDKFGFLWFGTQGGLTRFDGREFKTFRSEIDDPNSLADNSVWAIICDDHSNIWIGTNGGLSKYDMRTEKFTNYRFDPKDSTTISDNSIRTLLLDSNGTLWIGTKNGGLNSCEIETTDQLVFQRYGKNEHDKKTISSDYINDLYEDDAGYLWIATNGGGISRLNLNNIKQGFSHYTYDAKNQNSISSNNVNVLFHSNTRGLFCGTDKGLDFFDAKNEAFHDYEFEFNDIRSAVNKSVSSIAEDVRGNLWVGSNGEGLMRIDKNDTYFHFLPDDSANSLSGSDVRALYIDKQGLLWIGTYESGINLLYNGNSAFSIMSQKEGDSKSLSSPIVLSILEDSDGALWVGTWNGGVNRLKDGKNVDLILKNDPKDSKTLSGVTVWDMEEDSHGNIWIGSWKSGLNIIPKEERYKDNPKLLKYSNQVNDPKSLGSNSIMSLYKDSRGIMWIGTWGAGLNRIDSDDIMNGKIEFKKYEHDPENEKSICDNYIKTITEDSKGNIWIGTWSGGISVISKKDILQGKNEFKRYEKSWSDETSISHNDITAIYEDKEGIFWICTYGGGLNRLDPKTNNFKAYTNKDGLPNSELYGISEDNQGFLWVSSNMGISKFNPKDESFENYDSRDGLQGNEFNQGAFLKTSNGDLYFGGINGLTIIDPDEIAYNRFTPPVYFTDLQVNHKEVFVTKEGILTQSIENTNEISLSYTAGTFGLKFAALNYQQSEKNQYEYMLEGFDKKWIETGYPLEHVQYTNLNPGTYTFRVRASNNNDVWNENGASLTIHILPPWWKLWWVQLIGALIFFSIFLAVYKTRVYYLKRQQRVLEEQVRLSTEELRLLNVKLHEQNKLLDAAASASDLAFLNAQIKPHFLYNTLSTIMSLCEYDSLKAKNLIMSLSIHLRGMLEFQNLEEFVPLKDEIKLVKAYVLIEQARFENLEVTFDVNVDQSLKIPPIILQPLVENAIIHGIRKHRPEGSIIIRIVQQTNWLEVSIIDNGVGMKQAKIDELLIKPSKHGSIGLYNINRRLLKIYGQGLHIESQEGAGTTISFRILNV